jgi:uncharacterized membrane protein YhaH (DUF805 family)
LEILRRFAKFGGRTRRREFWAFTFVTGTIIIALVLFELWSGIIVANIENLPAKLYGVIAAIPFLAISSRRLHDTGRSSKWLFVLPFSPFQLILIIFFLQDSDDSNRYGLNPKELATRSRLGVEQRVINDLVEVHQAVGMSIMQAQHAAKEIVRIAKEELLEQGVDQEVFYLEGNGNKFLELAQTDPSVRAHLFSLRRHGVTDEDIRNWHNLSFFEKAVMLNTDKAIMAANVRNLVRRGYEHDEALLRVLKHHATFTDDPTKIVNRDSFLPTELKPRVNEYRNKRLLDSPDGFGLELDSYSSFNALIRDKQQNGLI